MRAASFALALALSACGGAQAVASPPQTVRIERAPDEIVLQEQGRMPRAVLRHRYADGSTSNATLEIASSFLFGVAGGDGQRQSMPMVRIHVRLRAGAVAADGSQRIFADCDDITIVDAAHSDPDGVAMVEGTYGRFRGVLAELLLDTNGSLATVDFSGLHVEESEREFYTRFAALYALLVVHRFPREEVGVGAKWYYVGENDLLGLHFGTRTTYTLTERDARRVVVSGQITGSRSEGQVRVPSAGNEMILALDSLNVTGSGAASLAHDGWAYELSVNQSIEIRATGNTNENGQLRVRAVQDSVVRVRVE